MNLNNKYRFFSDIEFKRRINKKTGYMCKEVTYNFVYV